MYAQNGAHNNSFRYNYDSNFDILYLFIGPPELSYEDELEPNIFLRYSEESEELRGALIMNYKYFDTKELKRKLPLHVDFNKINKDIFPSKKADSN
ncbi:DUF2283 domain-containing protein [Bacillus cereus group sp. BfR-BA-01347]|uniref:DUF2283 domain-containing protein n=1 Tax=Bacillus cereus group sp. BfR-BA-01347 TaxID=2920310 RepID=UPI001F5A20FA|nr:DUF2283 domain-containing protein [Bacillus cereus group sp. BfR-BA-01347]